MTETTSVGDIPLWVQHSLSPIGDRPSIVLSLRETDSRKFFDPGRLWVHTNLHLGREHCLLYGRDRL